MADGLLRFAAFCERLTVEDGSPFVIEEHELRIVESPLEGVRETVAIVPKKNGKSTLLAAYALFHLIEVDNALCAIAAASRDQAMWIFDQARGFVQRCPWLEDQVRVLRGYREIRRRVPGADEKDRAMFGMIKALAADEDTADGVIPTLALVDELHRHKKPELYAVLRDGLGPRNGQMVTISTAGDDLESPLGQLRTAAYALPGMERDGAYRYVAIDDFAYHEWALDDDEDRDDMSIVKLANPASWQTEAELRRRHDSPSMKPWQWARFACGVWLYGEQGAISAREWQECEDPTVVISAGQTGVTIGVDLGWRWDTTAIVPVGPWQPQPAPIGEPSIIVPPRDGSATDYDTIWEVCEAMAERFTHPTFVLDPEAGGEQLAQQIEQELDAEVVAHSQKPQAMALAAQRLSDAIANRQIRHGGYTDLSRHVLAAAAKPVGEGWRLVKPKGTSAVIDGAVALAMAVSVASVTKPKPAKLMIGFA